MTKIKLIITGIVLLMFISSIFTFKLYINKCNEFKELKDYHTTELVQRDSINKTHIVSISQLKHQIIKNDSVYSKVLRDRDIEIKRLESLGKIFIKDTIIINKEVVSEIPTTRDTLFDFNVNKNQISIYGNVKIESELLSINILNAEYNDEIIIYQYIDRIGFFKFRKRKELGYNAIGFRPIEIHKHEAISKYTGKKFKSESFIVK